VETIGLPLIDYGVAKFVLPGQTECGDQHLVCCSKDAILVAAIDGIGHGEEAAHAAKTASSILKTGLDEPIISVVRQCHEQLRSTRGIALSIASIDPAHGMMTWLGVGNVQGALLRAGSNGTPVQEVLLLRAGVVGAQLPPLQAAVVPVCQDDTLVFVTDGVRSNFFESLSALEAPQRAADRILERFRSGIDDALVLVARLTGIRR
jgi:phosphoserine phosphatase RsbX